MNRVMIIDDESDIAESLSVTLKSQGYDVQTAPNGVEGLRKIPAFRPALVLLDVMMPGMDGFEVCRQLKSNPETQSIPVLLLTALNQPEDKVKGLNSGADDFIEKPFEEAELKARIRAFLRTKELHDKLEESYLRLRELERLRDSLIHMLVHDLKAPLTAIKGGLSVFSEIAGADQSIPETVHQLLLNAESNSQRLLDMIQDILDVNRLEENKLPVTVEKVDLKKTVNLCLDLLTPTAQLRHVRLENKIEDILPPLSADSSLTQRVLTNLLSNSLKFTDSGGSVSVSARLVEKGTAVECVVADTGIGIPSHVLPRLFEKFFQGDNAEISRKGQGLGLAFCRLAMESQGGRIHAESEPGVGSKFILRFPIS